jgi:hypothetical protein
MPFAFWPTSPVVSQTWLDFLDFASSRADGTWLFRGHGDMAWELVPAIGRQPSVSAYRLADEKILCEEFALQSQRYLDAEGFTDLEWLAIAHHYGLPTRLLSWAANPLLAAWFATGEENTTCEGKVLALRVPSVRRLKSVPAFGAPHDPTVIVDVSPRVARITRQKGCFSLHPDPQSPWLPSPPAYDAAAFSVPASEKADFRRLLHIFGYDTQQIFGDKDALSKTLAWRYRQR